MSNRGTSKLSNKQTSFRMSQNSLTNINQKDYLKKYLSGPNKDKKKQRKAKKSQKDVRSTSKTKIIDDDVTLNKLDEYGRYSDEEFGEDAPQIAAIIDERPPHLQGKWKMLDERNEQSLLNLENIAKEDFSDSSASILRKRKDSDNDLSPPRLKDPSYSGNSTTFLGNKKRHDSDSDLTPPRNRKKSFQDERSAVLTKQNSDDVSLVRNRKRHDSDSDVSLPRKRKQHDLDSDVSPPRNRKRNDSDSDMSPPRNRKRHDLDIDTSHPKSRKNDNSDNVQLVSGNRKRNFSDDRSSSKFRRHDLYRNESPARNRKRHDSDNDVSPPRNRRVSKFTVVQTRRSSSPEYLKTVKQERQRRDSDSDRSSERHGKIRNPLSSTGSKPRNLGSSANISSSHHKKHDSDLTSSRRRGSDSDSDTNSRKSNRKKDEQEARQHHGVRASETLSGLKAGLQHATSLRDELQSAKEREKDSLKYMGSHSGKDAETVFRDRETGKKRDLKEERRQKRKEAEKMAEQQEKYLEWGRGVKQTADKKSQIEQDLYEMSKPLARYEDDPDLEKHLKEQEREGDPMLEFIRKRKAKQSPDQQTRPRYKGPPAPPNRFGIPPGYRWDGVDRSNGYEKKLFERTSSKVANQEEAYKWSVSDM